MSRPDFLVIGAMKCATSTLHDQLARQPGVFMTELKEPCYFSDDDVFARGAAWYDGLFADAPVGALCGESSTHYTKLPTHPRTVERCHTALPDARLVYVMRDPIDRLVSQYIHEWTQRLTSEAIDVAARRLPILVDYSRYAMQLKPWIEAYGRERVLPVCFERLTAQPQPEFEGITAFLGLPEPAVWHQADGQNVSSQRMRKSAWRSAIEETPGLKWARRHLVPQGWRDAAKRMWTMNHRPTLSDGVRAELMAELDDDMAELSAMLDREVTCATWKSAMIGGDAPGWRPAEPASNATPGPTETAA